MPPSSRSNGAEPLVMEWLLGGFGTTNRNARYSVLFWISMSLSDGILFSGTIGLLMQQLTLSLSKVGYSEGIFGACALIPGFLGGHIADTGRRDRIIRIGGVLSFLASSMMCALCLTCLISQDILDSLQPATITPVPSVNDTSSDSSSSSDQGYIPNQIDGVGSYLFLMVCILVCALYISESLSDAAYSAIQADSLQTGNRQPFMAKLTVWCNLIYVVGPLISLPFVVAGGNEWNTRGLLAVVALGAASRLPSVYISFLFNDDYSLERESEAIGEFSGEAGAKSDGKATPTPVSPPAQVAVASINTIQAVDSPVAAAGEADVEAKPGGEEDNQEDNLSNPYYAYIPIIYVLSDLVVFLGSGMTVKFFPIFFEDSLHLSPAVVYLVIALLPLLRAGGARVARRISEAIGRIPTDLAVWTVGVTALMGLIIQGYAGALETDLEKAIAVGLFLFRCVCLQSITFIQQSVMGDFVPKRYRARWAAFSAITQVGWSGSAVLGGVIIDHYGYYFAFLLTCIMHYLSLFRAVLLFIVPRWEQTVPPEGSSKRARHRRGEGTDDEDDDLTDESAPLLPEEGLVNPEVRVQGE